VLPLEYDSDVIRPIKALKLDFETPPVKP